MKKITETKRKIFLVKVPKYLGEQIRNMKNNASVGTISFSNNISVDFVNKIVPNNYNVSLKNETEKYAVDLFSENIIANECTHFLNITPVMDAKYFEFKKKYNAQKPAERSTRALEHFAEMKKGEKYANLKEMEAFAKKKKAQLQIKKRERLDKPDVIDILFKAFEKHTNWTVKDLSDFSGQPIAYIQEIIGEIAVLDKTDYRNTYVLKEQFK